MDRKAGKLSQVFSSCHPVPLQCCLLYWISVLSRGMARIATHLGEGWNGTGLLSTVLERWEGSASPVGFPSRQLETVSASSVPDPQRTWELPSQSHRPGLRRGAVWTQVAHMPTAWLYCTPGAETWLRWGGWGSRSQHLFLVS